jgi:hypothetical protein
VGARHVRGAAGGGRARHMLLHGGQGKGLVSPHTRGTVCLSLSWQMLLAALTRASCFEPSFSQSSGIL